MGLAASQADPCSTRQPTNELTWPWLCGTVGGAQPTAPGCRRGPLFPSLALGSCHGHHKGGSAVPMRICQGKQGKVCPRTGTRRNRGGKPLRAKLESLWGSPRPFLFLLLAAGAQLIAFLHISCPPSSPGSQPPSPPCSPLAGRTRALAQRPLSSRTLCGPPYTPGSMAHRPRPARCADGGTEAQEEARDTAQY